MKISVAIIMVLLLVGCKASSTDEYLLAHPDRLEKELNRCKSTENNSAFCNHLQDLAREFIILSNERALNPEKFGKEVMLLEYEIVKLEHELKNEKSDNKRVALQENYQQTSVKLKKLLSIIAATSSPEA